MARTNRQVAFLFNEAGDLTADRIGNKALSLVAMTGMGMPVPPGFAISTGICRAYLEHARYPKRLEWHIRRCLETLEKQTGKRFGDPSNPLLVSVRSGAPVSMPGMMDTVLNLGITSEALPTLERLGGQSFARDTYHRFQTSFGKVVGSQVDDPQEQLQLAFEAVCQSWLNDRAVEYRRAHQISDDLGTAMIVQAMVFGNLNSRSGTGVVFSRNVTTGDREIYGEFLPQAQGEDVVGGSVTPLPISFFAKEYPEAFKKLTDTLAILEAREKDIVEIEFTVESGKLWTLQYRVAKRTPVATARFLVQSVWEKRITKATAIAQMSETDVEKIRRPQFSDTRDVILLGSGLAASPGAAVGVAVFSSRRAQELVAQGQTVILIRPETNPDDFAGMLVAAAIVTEHGGVTSHAAVVARAMGKPAVVGVKEWAFAINEVHRVSVDGTNGLVFLGRVPFVDGVRHKETSIFLKWFDESRPKGRWDFSMINQCFSANFFLNDFYLSEAMAKATEGTELGQKARHVRNRTHQKVAELFATYLLLAISGELRHGWHSALRQWRSPVFSELEKQFGLPKEKTGSSYRTSVQETVVRGLSIASREKQIEFLRLAVAGFLTWTSGAYGGSNWAAIAQAILDYLDGTLNCSVFVDRVFDLRHNGGVLFNKHKMFADTRELGVMSRQLDVKRQESNINTLYEKLLCTGGTKLSPEVAGLWKEGLSKYWSEPNPQSAWW